MTAHQTSSAPIIAKQLPRRFLCNTDHHDKSVGYLDVGVIYSPSQGYSTCTVVFWWQSWESRCTNCACRWQSHS